MKRSYSGALCGRCVEWVRDVVYSSVARVYVCLECDHQINQSTTGGPDEPVKP